MDKVNFAIVKIVQFLVILFFTLILAFYFGNLLLIPLAILIGVINLFSALDFNGVFATICAVPVVGWLCFSMYRIPALFQTVLDTGVKLYGLGISQNQRFEEVAKKLKNQNSRHSGTQSDITTA